MILAMGFRQLPQGLNKYFQALLLTVRLVGYELLVLYFKMVIVQSNLIFVFYLLTYQIKYCIISFHTAFHHFNKLPIPLNSIHPTVPHGRRNAARKMCCDISVDEIFLFEQLYNMNITRS